VYHKCFYFFVHLVSVSSAALSARVYAARRDWLLYIYMRRVQSPCFWRFEAKEGPISFGDCLIHLIFYFTGPPDHGTWNDTFLFSSSSFSLRVRSGQLLLLRWNTLRWAVYLRDRCLHIYHGASCCSCQTDPSISLVCEQSLAGWHALFVEQRG
jgi:hypothetical protein